MTNDLATRNGVAETEEEAKPLVRTPVIAGPRGLQLTSLEEMFRFATAVAKSGLAPKGLEHPEAIFVALQMGAELGLTPMASLQNIAVINGRPSVWGDAMLAVCRSQGVFDEAVFEERMEGGGDELTAICIVRRLPHGKPIQREFSVARAKKAGLWGKSGPWTQYPERMLQMRARSFALRDGFADILRGFKSAEEMYDTIDVQHTPVVNQPRTLDDLANRLESPAADPVREAIAAEQKPKRTKKTDSLLPEEEVPTGSSTYHKE